MGEFDYYFTFYGLVLGLSVATVIAGLGRALNAEGQKRVGLLTLLMALFVLLDIVSFWLWAWGERTTFRITFPQMYGGLFISGTYCLAASLVFPEADAKWPSPDAHYWAKKRWVFAGILAANLMILTWSVSHKPPALDDWMFYFWQLAFIGPLTALLFTRRRTLDVVLIGILIAYYGETLIGALPGSLWGADTPL